MLYILLHKNLNGTFVEMVTENKMKAVKKLISLYYNSLLGTPDNEISDFDMTNDQTFYAEIVYSEDETEWWEIVPFDKNKIQ